jgi:hypothetical protein
VWFPTVAPFGHSLEHVPRGFRIALQIGDEQLSELHDGHPSHNTEKNNGLNMTSHVIIRGA